ncbi:MAG: cohesin domain-containing protein [Planctomycetota bacterium]|jgi:hypothetical protein
MTMQSIKNKGRPISGFRTLAVILVVATVFCSCLGEMALRHEKAAPRAAAVEGEQSSETPVDERGLTSGTKVVVSVDVGDRMLGGYALELRYDPEAVEVVSVQRPGREGFPGSPMAEPATFAKGTTPLVGFHVGGYFPSGLIHVAVVRFKAKKPGKHPLSLSVKSLYSPEGKPVPGTGQLSPATIRGR